MAQVASVPAAAVRAFSQRTHPPPAPRAPVQAEYTRGEVMVYQLAQTASDFLAQHNNDPDSLHAQMQARHAKVGRPSVRLFGDWSH